MMKTKLTKIGKIGVLSFCFLLQVGLAGGDAATYHQNKTKINVPMEIELYFSSAPMLNEPTILNIEIRVLRDAPNTLIDIELPSEGFELISGNLHLNEDLSSGSTTIYQLEVLPVAKGQYKIAASATSEQTDFIFGKKEELYVNITDGFSEQSKSNFIPETADPWSEATKIGNVCEAPTQALQDLKPIVGQDVSYFAAPDPGQIMVKGYWYYQDRAGVNQPLRDARIEIWDADSSGDDLLATTYTDNSGYYASDNISNTTDEEGGQDIYVRVFSTDDRSVSVTDFSASDDLYYFDTPVQNDVADGEVDLGIYVLDDANNRMAWYIYDLIANDAFDFLANVGWQNLTNLQVRWSPTNTSKGTYYRPGSSIDLLAGDRWDSDVFLHEYSHFVMYKIYGDSLPPSPDCYNHFWGSDSSLGCAWTEGWANFLQGAIQNDKFYDDTEDQKLHIDFEIPKPSAEHPEDEGAVAASLWDIFDPVAEAEIWDDIGNGINGSSNNGIWSIVYGDGPNDFLEFLANWIQSSNGYNSEVTAIAQHHLINPDTTRPSITITAPTTNSTYATGQSTLNIGGSASDNVAVTAVSWSNSRGGSGTCSGTSSWSKTGIALSSGQNVITVTARDAAGNTKTDSLTVTYTPPSTPPEIVEKNSYPHDAQGIDTGTLRVPNDTSIVARIKSDDGIDEDSVEMRIENKPVNIRVQEVNEGDDTDCWIIHAPKTPFAFEHQVNIAVDAKNLNGIEMDTYYSSFKTESQEEHTAALSREPASKEYENNPASGQNTIVADPATIIEGAQIIYDHLEPVVPRFGPLEEVPDLDIAVGVGVPLNLQPANVFVNPVTVFIPCPGETDLENLEIYVLNPAIGWQASWETDGCIVPGSRVNHGPDDPDPTEPPTIEIQLNHFSGVQAGKTAVEIPPSAGAGNEAVAEKASDGGGGGGGCFITAAVGESNEQKIDITVFLLLLILGLIGFVGIRRALKK